jgi:hypothetical protein
MWEGRLHNLRQYSPQTAVSAGAALSERGTAAVAGQTQQSCGIKYCASKFSGFSRESRQLENMG